jgi:outer membrane protein TolC
MKIEGCMRPAVAAAGYLRAAFVHALFACLVLLAVSVLPAVAIEPDAEEVLTLSEAIAIALKNQPMIEAQHGQALAAEAKAGQERGAYYPKLSVGTQYTRIYPVSPQTSSTTSLAGIPPGSSSIPTSIDSRAATYEQYAATGNLSQLLFDFGRTPARVAASTLGAQAARLELQNVREQIIFKVKEAYYTLLAFEQGRRASEEIIVQYRKRLEYARALFSVGARPKFDVTKAEVELSNQEVQLIKTENGVRQARAQLNNAIGMPNRPAYSVKDNGPDLQWIEQPFEEGLRRAFEHRPDLLSLQKQKEAAEESVKAARRGHYPTFNGFAQGTYVGTGFPLDHGWTAGVNMSLPLFTGFITSHQVAEAKAGLLVASGKERDLKQTITLELEQGYLALRDAAERIKGTETAVKQGRENLGLANERYSAGLAIAVEVTDAIGAYANALYQNIAAHYDYRIAQARIDKATGGGQTGGVEKSSPYLTFSGK